MSPEMKLARALSNVPKKEKTSSRDEAMEKLSWADEFGRELAREHMEKLAINPVSSLTQQVVGKGMHAALGTGALKRTAVGAAGGAALGGAGGLMKTPTVDPATGQRQSRLGNAMAGAVGGGVVGGGLGLGARTAAHALGSSNSGIGRYAGGALKSEAKRTGHLGVGATSYEMQANRLRGATEVRGARQAGQSHTLDPRAPGGNGMAPSPTGTGALAPQRPGLMERLGQKTRKVFNAFGG
jgi:hypothetical protein